MTGQARDAEDNTTNRAAWRNKIISYTGHPRWRDKPGTQKTTQQTGQHGGIRSSAIQATPDDGTSQGRRRRRRITRWQMYRNDRLLCEHDMSFVNTECTPFTWPASDWYKSKPLLVILAASRAALWRWQKQITQLIHVARHRVIYPHNIFFD